MKLITMTDFVLKQEKQYPCSDLTDYNETNDKVLKSIINYANFLKQPLTLGMFIPCDEEGNVLEKHCRETVKGCRDCACREYDKSKERVLFEGFRVVFNQSNLLIIIQHKSLVLSTESDFKGNILIQHLEYDNLTLTDSAIKQLGL